MEDRKEEIEKGKKNYMMYAGDKSEAGGGLVVDGRVLTRID